MSFDDYAEHIYQKHRLAVALAIIKTKPPNVPTSQYVRDLKSKLDEKMDDDDVTVCSDDFLVDDDDEMNESVTILKDFDLENVFQEDLLRSNEEYHKVNPDDGKNDAEIKQTFLPEDLTQTTFCDISLTRSSKEPDTVANDTRYDDNFNLDQNDIEQNILTNTLDRNDENNKMKHPDHNTRSSNKLTDKNNQHSLNNEEFNAPIDCESVNDFNDKNLDTTYYDSQKTVLYTVHGYTQNYSYYSPSQNDIIIPNNHIYGADKNKTDRSKNSNVNTYNNDVNIVNPKMINSQNVNEFSNEIQRFSKNDTAVDKINKNPLINEEIDSNQTLNMCSLNNYEHLNQIRNNLATNSKTTTINDTDAAKDNINNPIEPIKTNTTQFSQNIYEYFEEMQNVEEIENLNNFPNRKQDTIQDMDITNEPFNTQNVAMVSQNIDIGNNQKANETDTKLQDTIDISIDERFKTQDKIKTIHENLNQNIKLTQNSDNEQLASIIHEDKEEEEYNSEEVISYKVLEEFNRVKTFLNRPNRRMSFDGYSTDSGYRSDSQSRNSNRSALQLSGNWLNQSGCCLFNHIMQCPLVAATRDITNEIAQVLSQLIDRLHEEEKYPSFLEEILETVDVLLRQVYEGASSGDSEFLKQDENVQRLLLLNKSIHIQEHSIERISNILETFHSKVTEIEITYELTNIDQIENISYVFHVLEILLKKYLKKKDLCSQTSSQLSQEEKIFKKSSITDIWRKKWNPNQKVFEGSREKKCVLKLCSEILNKIIVDCVNTYSLVAYSALKCFNSMQS